MKEENTENITKRKLLKKKQRRKRQDGIPQMPIENYRKSPCLIILRTLKKNSFITIETKKGLFFKGSISEIDEYGSVTLIQASKAKVAMNPKWHAVDSVLIRAHEMVMITLPPTFDPCQSIINDQNRKKAAGEKREAFLKKRAQPINPILPKKKQITQKTKQRRKKKKRKKDNE